MNLCEQFLVGLLKALIPLRQLPALGKPGLKVSERVGKPVL